MKNLARITCAMLLMATVLGTTSRAQQTDNPPRKSNQKYSDFIAALGGLENSKFRDLIIEEARHYLRRYQNAADVDKVHLRIANLHDEAGDRFDAFFTYMEIIYLYPKSEVTTVARDRVRTLLVQEKKFYPIASGIDKLLHPATLDSTREASSFAFLRDMNALRFERINKQLLDGMQLFLTTFPHSVHTDAILFWRGELLISTRQPYAALSAFLKLTYVHDKSLYVTASKLKIAELFTHPLKDHQRAMLALEEFLLEYPEDPQAPTAQKQIAIINEKYKKKYLEAINAYTAVAQRYPKSVEAVPAMFDAARLYEDKFKEYDQAIRMYTEIVRDFGTDMKAPYALAEAARIYEKKLKDFFNAANVYHKVYGHYPESGIAAQSLFAAAELNEKKLRDFDKAIDYYRIVIDKYSDSKLAEKAGKRISKLSKDVARQ